MKAYLQLFLPAALLATSCIALVAAAGCLTDESIERVDRILDKAEAALDAQAEPKAEVAEEPKAEPKDEVAEEPKAEVAAEADAVPFADLDFCWGGFSGSKASLGAGRIGSLKVSGSGLSYRTEAGWASDLGCSSREDAGAIACLFCRIDGRWRGGKFDWVSESRSTRDFKNIAESYHGWDSGAVSKASEYAFVIISRDGRRRTNVARCGR